MTKNIFEKSTILNYIYISLILYKEKLFLWILCNMSKQIIELSLIEERNCELIIKAFLDLTDSKKVEFIKVNDVIQEIKISKGTFYKYFSGKTDLINKSVDWLAFELNKKILKPLISEDFSDEIILNTATKINVNKRIYKQVTDLFVDKSFVESKLMMSSGLDNKHILTINRILLFYLTNLFKEETDCTPLKLKETIKVCHKELRRSLKQIEGVGRNDWNSISRRQSKR